MFISGMPIYEAGVVFYRLACPEAMLAFPEAMPPEGTYFETRHSRRKIQQFKKSDLCVFHWTLSLKQQLKVHVQVL